MLASGNQSTWCQKPEEHCHYCHRQEIFNVRRHPKYIEVSLCCRYQTIMHRVSKPDVRVVICLVEIPNFNETCFHIFFLFMYMSKFHFIALNLISWVSVVNLRSSILIHIDHLVYLMLYLYFTTSFECYSCVIWRLTEETVSAECSFLEDNFASLVCIMFIVLQPNLLF